MDDKTKLFGRQTKHDWLVIRAKILSGSDDKNNWFILTQLLNQRIDTRYFKPIERILKMKLTSGEGFAVMTLICSLIEFLQSTYEGKTYELNGKETKHIYNSSSKMFKNFLEQQLPFNKFFDKPVPNPTGKIKTYADDFYINVRCGLLHEAATNNGWVIKTSKINETSKNYIELTNPNNKIIYRDKFFEVIKIYFNTFQKKIIDNTKDNNNQFIRDNVCRKIDSLCLINDKTPQWWSI